MSRFRFFPYVTSSGSNSKLHVFDTVRHCDVGAMSITGDPQSDCATHYTGAIAGRSILSTGLLRATWYKDFADEEEIIFGQRLLRAAFKRYRFVGRAGISKDWLRQLLWKDMADYFELPIYVVCASADSDVHHLWETYASLDGCAITMRTGSALKLSILDRTGCLDRADFNLSSWRRVSYSTTEHHRYADAVINYFANVPIDLSTDDWASYVAIGLFNFVPFMKTKEFRREQEIRLVVQVANGDAVSAEHLDGRGRRYVECTFANELYTLEGPSGGLEALSAGFSRVVTSVAPLPPYGVYWYSERHG